MPVMAMPLSDSGVQAIIIEDDFVGVVAESRLQAYTGLQQLALEWDEGKRWQQTEIDDLVTVGNGLAIVIQEDGNTDLNANDTEIVSLELRTPLAAHAHLEPQAALADVQADKVDIWMSTQAPFRVRDLVAAALGRDPSSIAIHPVYLGGGFGRKLNSEAGVEAATFIPGSRQTGACRLEPNGRFASWLFPTANTSCFAG